MAMEGEGEKNNFRRFMQFVFKNNDELRPIPPIYVVFYSKNEYRAFKRQIKHLSRDITPLQNRQFFVYQRYPWAVQPHLSIGTRPFSFLMSKDELILK